MHKFNGVTFLEVLISLLILSFVLWAFAAMQMQALRNARHAYYLLIAAEQVNSMLERLYGYGQSTQLINQVNEWNQENQQVLPKGLGQVQGVYPNFEIMIYWGDPPYHCEVVAAAFSDCLTLRVTL